MTGGFLVLFFKIYINLNLIFYILKLTINFNLKSAIGNTVPLIIGRILIGMTYSGYSSIGSLYASEICIKEYRGYSGTLFSFLFGVGIKDF
jgi:hypothetical protein